MYYFLLMVIIFLPLQKLFEAVAGLGLSPSLVFWLSHWYEIGLLVILVAAGITLIRRRSCPNFKALYQPALYFVALSLLSALFLSATPSRGLEGFRFTALPVVFLLVSSLSLIDKKQQAALLKCYITMAVIVAIWAILERALPLNYWHLADFGWGKYSLIDRVYQSTTFMNGPNQVASYLLPAFFLKLTGSTSGNKAKNFLLTSVLPAIIILAGIFLTFSRSAAVACVAVMVLYFAVGKLKTRFKIGGAALLLILVLAAYLLVKSSPRNFEALVYHGASQTGHQQSLQLSLDELKSRSFDRLMIGAGIGSAGPAAIKYGDGIVSESWYIQLLLEMGVLGLALWLWLIYDLSAKLWRNGREGLALGVIAVSVAAIFLHTWADNPAIAVTAMILAGAYLNQPKKIKEET